jgi:dienelactone hydrolase
MRKRRWPPSGTLSGEGRAAFEEHAYPGSGHLFTDPDLPEYDHASSEEMWRRVLAFLARIDARGSDAEREASL